MLALAASVQAATTSWSPTAPTVDGADIYQLSSFAGGVDANNVDTGADNATYIAYDQPAQGQTFTTGANAGGYFLSAITVKHAENTGGWSLDSGWDAFNGRFEIFVGQISLGVFSHDWAEVAGLGGSDPDSPGFNGNTGPQGGYVTFTLDTAITLAPNTVYGYSIYTLADQFGGGYFPSDGVNSDVFAGGNAFAEAGGAVTEYAGGDRVFHLDIAAVPEPSTFALAGLGLAALVCLRRHV